MRRTLLLLAVMACLGMASTLLQGCGIAYRHNAEELAKTAKPEDYGSMPTDYENAIKSLMADVLIDPDSVRYSNWEAPRQAIIPNESASPTPILGWQVDVYINSKNRMGGYTGAKRYGFFFINNKIYAYGERWLDVLEGSYHYSWNYFR